MQLILMRHALAEERSDRWPDDGKRPLTKEGERKHRSISEALRRMGVAFDEILSSPLVRARQTADITARAYAWSRPSVVSPIPRRGRFAIRSSETVSKGLSRTWR